MNIPFNQTYLFGEEKQFIAKVMASGNVAGNGLYTKKCHQFFKDNYGVEHCLLTNSCTAALEMAAILLDIQPGDEVIVPAYGYISTANAFVLRGAKIVFVDAMKTSPNLNINQLSELISNKTKAIVVMHYGGIAVDMDAVMNLANAKGVYVVEDAAHSVDAYYNEKPLGTIGHLGTLSFHSTKNITCGHGGLLMVNDSQFIERSNTIWQKGTDKTKFDLGHQGFYEWIDLGSSFFPSELTAAYLYGQLLNLKEVTTKRVELWNIYYSILSDNINLELPILPSFAQHNGHIFYVKVKSKFERQIIIEKLSDINISVYSHYLNLAKSPYVESNQILENALIWEDCLLRLPIYYDLSLQQINHIIKMLKNTYSF